MITIQPGTPDTAKPTVLMENLWAAGTLTVSSEAVDAEGENAYLQGTFQYWTPTAMPATFEVDLGATGYADSLGIAAHDLGSKGATVALERWDGAAWVQVASVTPTDDTTIMVLFQTVGAARWRLNITGAATFSIGYTALGRRIVLPGIVGDYTPTDWGERIEVLGGKSVSGQFLPQRALSFGAETTVSLGRIRRQWHETTGRAFQHHFNRGRSFFFAGYPEALTNDVALCQRSEGRPEMRSAIVDRSWVVIAFDVDCYVPPDLTYTVDYSQAVGGGAVDDADTLSGGGGAPQVGGGGVSDGDTLSGGTASPGGVNLVSNGEFDDATGWTLSSGWTISGGTLSCDGTDASTADISIPELVEGNQYRIQFDLSGSVTALSIRLGSAFTNLYTADPSDGANGFVDETLTATAGTTLRFRCNGANGFVGDIDNLVVTLVGTAASALLIEGTTDALLIEGTSDKILLEAS